MNISLVARDDLIRRVASARSVALSAYVLAPENAVVRALEGAADRGATVSVTLDGAPHFGSGSADAPNPNLACAEALRAHGVTVRLSDPGEASVHLKAAVVDGEAFLDDRNWPASGRATLVETEDPDAVRAIGDAIAGRPHSDGDLALSKAAALALEAQTIRASGAAVDIATETFGASDVSAALGERARAGARVRLIVNAHVLAGPSASHERAAIAKLQAAGVEVRAVATAEKFAVSGEHAWVGSANATASDPMMLDWGIRSDDARLARSLEQTFEGAWARGAVIA